MILRNIFMLTQIKHKQKGGATSNKLVATPFNG